MIFKKIKHKKPYEWRQLRSGEVKNWKYGMITFAQSSFSREYSIDARTYVFTSDNKVFNPKMMGNSLFATSLDRSDYTEICQYIATQHPWEIEGVWVISEEDYNAVLAGEYDD